MSTLSFNQPELDGVLLAEVFETAAAHNLHYPIAYIIDGDKDDPSVGMETVTWSAFMAAATKTALALRESLPARALAEAPLPVAVLAKNTCGNLINIMAMIMNRWAPLLISPKNSPAGVAHLLNNIGARCFFVERSFLSLLPSVTEALPSLLVKVIEPAPVAATEKNGDHILTPQSPENIQAELDKPALFMHTSGSTDFPKVIPYSHRFILTSAKYRRRDRRGEGSVVYTPSPVWHALGMGLIIVAMPAVGDIHLFVTSQSPPTGQAMLRYIKPFDKPHIATPPSFLEEISRMGPDAIAQLARTKDITAGGAALNQGVGDLLVSKGVRLGMFYGSTELSWASRSVPSEDPSEWPYVNLEDAHLWEFRPIGDGSFELLAKCTPGRFPAVTNESNPPAFATRDLWVPHPTKPLLWKHVGRKDDITILNTGLKTNNRQIEDLLRQDPLISQAVVFGTDRFLNGVLVQPSSKGANSDHFLNDIWPTVEHVNTLVPRHSRLLRELVLQGVPSKPFPETDKGTVRTKHVIREYQDEIDQAYESLGEWSEVAPPEHITLETVRKYVRESIVAVLGHVGKDDEVCFDYGVDSVHAIRLRSALQALITSQGKTVEHVDMSLPQNVVYQYPTVERLASFFFSSLERGVALQVKGETGDASLDIQSCIERFSQGLHSSSPAGNGAAEPANSSQPVYVLTGTTGSLMSSLLALLLQSSTDSKIYCLNRSSNTSALERHLKGFAMRGLNEELLKSNPERLQFLDIDLSRQDLGLTEGTRSELRKSMDCLIHGAWQVNFNLTLEGFEKTHVAGVRHLIDLCLSSQRHPRFCFLSSVAACGNSPGPVLEDVLTDLSAPLDMGYAKSKFVAERLVALGAEAGLLGTIVRIGQVSGSTSNGAWNLSEHMPIIFRSSSLLGVFPADLPDIHWLPVEATAQAIHDIVAKTSGGLTVFHVENCDTTLWTTVVKAAQQATPNQLRPVTSKEWLSALSTRGSVQMDVPGTRLFGFMETLLAGQHMPLLDVTRTMQSSKAVLYGALPTELICKYVEYALNQ